MKSLYRILLIVTFLAWCWLAMMAVHECGHVVTAQLTGGTVKRVVWRPLKISRTDVEPNPAPHVVVWGGPVLGVLFPLLIWKIARGVNQGLGNVMRFFAGFCLIANGTYIGIGSFDAVGDAGVMLKHGAPIWLLWLWGVAATTVGLRLWHGLGPRMGLDRLPDAAVPFAALASLLLLIATLALALLVSA